ncbi:MAG: replication-associated recombination protein A [Erysipelothrix sp.]|jgi:putative ATPase|nr:replication-associated recombination protein A [Erysipelothrix sp.]
MSEPLAHRLRPQTIDDCVGQSHLFSERGLIRKLVEDNNLPSLIFYGPSGVGKTTAALAMTAQLNRPYDVFNAAINNKKQLDDIIDKAKQTIGFVLIMDEVHRMNKDKQDHLLPYLENGVVTLIGCTTANPLFSINPAIRSRCHLIPFKPIEQDDIVVMLKRALSEPLGLKGITADDEALQTIAKRTGFDVRLALNTLELCSFIESHIKIDTVDQVLIEAMQVGFKDDDGHYDLLSAFQKSIRGSDVDASIYYLGRLIMLNDLESITRRLIVIAYEDVGLANPPLVARVVLACDSALRIGLPEARIILANAVIECASSIKSKSANIAIDNALSLIKNESHQIPEYLILTPVKLPEAQRYDYSRSDLWIHIGYLPQSIKNVQFYNVNHPSPFEKTIIDNVEKLRSVEKSYDMKALKKKHP